MVVVLPRHIRWSQSNTNRTKKSFFSFGCGQVVCVFLFFSGDDNASKLMAIQIINQRLYTIIMFRFRHRGVSVDIIVVERKKNTFRITTTTTSCCCWCFGQILKPFSSNFTSDLNCKLAILVNDGIIFFDQLGYRRKKLIYIQLFLVARPVLFARLSTRIHREVSGESILSTNQTTTTTKKKRPQSINFE